MAKTTFRNSVRVAGASRTSWAGVPVLVMKASFDPTSATQILLGTLPAGSIPLGVQSLGGATGGTNPTVDIGTVASNAGIANEVDADTLTLTYATGAPDRRGAHRRHADLRQGRRVCGYWWHHDRADQLYLQRQRQAVRSVRHDDREKGRQEADRR
jgi:hypothetical protein